MSIPVLFLLLFGAALCAWQLIACGDRLAANPVLFDRESNGLHLLMNTGMALMLMPVYDTHIRDLIVFGYCAASVYLSVQILIRGRAVLRREAKTESRLGGRIYHLLALIAMIYAALQMSHMTAAMPAHHGGHAIPESNWVLQGLGVIFLLDALAFIVVIVFFADKVLKAAEKQIHAETRLENTPSLRDLRLSVIPHICMDIGMVYMLLLPM